MLHVHQVALSDTIKFSVQYTLESFSIPYLNISKLASRDTQKGVLHKLPPGRRCLSNIQKVCSDVTERQLLAWNQNKSIRNYVFYILITKFSIVLSYNSTDLMPTNKHSQMLLIFKQPVRIKQLIKQEPLSVSAGTQTH